MARRRTACTRHAVTPPDALQVAHPPHPPESACSAGRARFRYAVIESCLIRRTLRVSVPLRETLLLREQRARPCTGDQHAFTFCGVHASSA